MVSLADPISNNLAYRQPSSEEDESKPRQQQRSTDSDNNIIIVDLTALGEKLETEKAFKGRMTAAPEVNELNHRYHDDDKDEGPSMLLIPSGTSSGTSTKKRNISIKTLSLTESSPGGGKRKRKPRTVMKRETGMAIFIKYAVLVLLVAQMVGLVLLMRYTRTRGTDDPEHPPPPLYLASTAVFLMEVMKLCICTLVIALQSGCSREVWEQTFQTSEIVKLCIPSLLYTAQNNLLYLALTNLDVATYQVCYQLKILTTALFSVLLLNRKFSTTKWMAVILLTIGVAIVQLSGSDDQQHHHADDNPHVVHGIHSQDDAEATHHRLMGFLAVLCAACTSGFSGVYFERILKGSNTSLWIRNVQMGIPSVVVAYITIYVKDGAAVRSTGFFGGYSILVWLVITVQALGGLIVATVVKYADNVLKVFAASFSIVVSCVISAFLFDFHPSRSFLVGASLVVTATVMYSSPERRLRRKPVLPLLRPLKE